MNEDKEKGGNAKGKKAETVGPDGLTKKERRALKVAQKGGQPQSDKTTLNDAGDSIQNTQDNSQKKEVAATDQQPNIEQNTPSKAQLRAERRALQEQQRLKKEQEKAAAQIKQLKEEHKLEVPQKTSPKKTETRNESQYLFNHLEYKFSDDLNSENCVHPGIHPSFIKMRVQYQEGVVCGSNARSVGLVICFIDFITDMPEQPSMKSEEFCKALENGLKKQIAFLEKGRPFSIGMVNIIKDFFASLNNIDKTTLIEETKEKLFETLDSYIHNYILKAADAISMNVGSKINDGDVILTFSCSSLVKRVLCDAFDSGKKFKVIIVDANPYWEGKSHVQRLIAHGIACEFALINAVSFVIGKATKVILGAHALLADGSVMSRIGTALVATAAHELNKPVIVCCEKYKFCERVQVDCFVHNEIGDPNKLVNEVDVALAEWKKKDTLTPLNLIYDFTLPKYVSLVMTDIGSVQSKAAPAILRMKPVD